MTLHPFVRYTPIRITWIEGGTYHAILGTDRRRTAGNPTNGKGLQRDRIRVTETDVDGGKMIGHLYTSGPYAMTVGRPLYFEGDVQDRERVCAAADHIMNRIRNLARESEGRVRSAQAAEANALPALAWLAGAR